MTRSRHRRYLTPPADRKDAAAELVLHGRIERLSRRFARICVASALVFAALWAVDALFHPFGQVDFYGKRIRSPWPIFSTPAAADLLMGNGPGPGGQTGAAHEELAMGSASGTSTAAMPNRSY